MRFTYQQIKQVLDNAKVSSSNQDINNLYPWDIEYPQASLEAITTAQIEYFRKVILNENFVPFWQTSRVFVKNPSDSWYSGNGYPNPPLGAVFRTVQRDGLLGYGNFVEVMPAFFIVDMALRLNDLDSAQKALSFIQYMTHNASFYGSPIKIVSGIARYENGSWVRSYDTIINRNIFGAVWAFFRYANYTGNVSYAEIGRGYLNTLALFQNNTIARIQRNELPGLLAGSLYAHMVPISYPNFAFVWNRWTIEGNWLFYLAVKEAANWYGWDAVLEDSEGTPFTLRQLLQRLGSFYDNWFYSGKGIMKQINPNSLYLPYQFIINRAWYNHESYIVGANFDWTGESGTIFGDTWWVGDLELWGLIGMALLRNDGFMTFPVERFFAQFEELGLNNQPIFHDRYSFFGKTLLHDSSISITFSALFGYLMSLMNENIYNQEKNNTNEIFVKEVKNFSDYIDLYVYSHSNSKIKVKIYDTNNFAKLAEFGPFSLNKEQVNVIKLNFRPRTDIKIDIEKQLAQ